ncbi:MAG: T9SS type A sorting domain-containing protein [Bacteroidales bacterium]|nr:T9SS type A sorting domain-containing protein [Bacteroidales bacterium]
MKKIIFVALVLYIIPCSYSQTASSDIISASGSSIEAEGFVMSWTIGENIIDFYQDYPGMTGYNYPDIFMRNGILITVYPTLTREFVFIRVEAENSPVLQAELSNVQGNSLITIPLNTDEVEMNIGDFPYGTYFLRISDPDHDDYKIVKIIKQ